MSILNHVSVNARLAAIRVSGSSASTLPTSLNYISTVTSASLATLRSGSPASHPSLQSPPHLAYSANPSSSLIHTGTPLTSHSLSTRRSFLGSALRGVLSVSRYRGERLLRDGNETSEGRGRKRDDENKRNGKQTDTTRLHKRKKRMFEFLKLGEKELKLEGIPVMRFLMGNIFGKRKIPKEGEITDLRDVLISNIGNVAGMQVLLKITSEDLETFFLGEEMMNEASEELVDEMWEVVHSLLMEAILHERDEYKKKIPIRFDLSGRVTHEDFKNDVNSAQNAFNTKVKNTIIFFINEKTAHTPDTTHTADSTDTPHTSSVTSIDWRAEMQHFIGTKEKTFGTHKTNKRGQTHSDDDDDDEVDEVSERFQASLKKFFQYLSRSSR
eukprot:GHVN01074852.1.p1 GENE.GHVN01074852.1~~GHVN01074852.1.p1  ORF type:complete len:384 (-),score=90.74 GHVN01074852.1:26-1177(-)